MSSNEDPRSAAAGSDNDGSSSSPHFLLTFTFSSIDVFLGAADSLEIHEDDTHEEEFDSQRGSSVPPPLASTTPAREGGIDDEDEEEEGAGAGEGEGRRSPEAAAASSVVDSQATSSDRKTSTSSSSSASIPSAAASIPAAAFGGGALVADPVRNSAATGEILFEDIIVKVIGSVVRLDVKSKAYTSYIIVVTCQGVERWRIEKRFSAFYELDDKVGAPHPSFHAIRVHFSFQVSLSLLLTSSAQAQERSSRSRHKSGEAPRKDCLQEACPRSHR